MVDIERSTAGIADAMADMDLRTSIAVGGLSLIGIVVASSVGSVLAGVVPNGIDPSGRLDAAAIGLGAVLAAVGGQAFLPGYLSGPLAVGSTIVLGAATLAVVLGLDTDDFDGGRIRNMMHSADLTSGSSVLSSGCTSCGPSRPVRASPPETPPYPGDPEQIREIGQGPSVPRKGFR